MKLKKTSQLRNEKSKRFIQPILFGFVLLGIILIRIYAISMYKVPSESMKDCIEPGDYILVNKLSFGPRVLDWYKLFINKEITYNYYTNYKSIRKGDIIVFDKPEYKTFRDTFSNMFGPVFVKRCYALPGDTVIINNEGNEKNERNEGNENNERNESKKANGVILPYEIGIEPDLYPYDSTLNWRIDNYGPLWVPARGANMQLTPQNAKHYKDVLLYEGNKTETRNDSVFLNGKFTEFYSFKFNYYFMLGDNFNHSSDSRYWGFVPQTHVIGKAVLVLYSLDTYKPWYKSFKWNRFLKKLR
jgi:signal peptidase I